MKIRIGFVSNSSSSSFICAAKTSYDVYKEMAEFLIKNDKERSWQDSGFEDKAKMDKWVNKRDKVMQSFLDTHKGYNGGIYLPYSCNYETFISPSENGYVRVDSCNNESWSETDLVFSKYTDDGESLTFKKERFYDIRSNTVKTQRRIDKETYIYRRQECDPLLKGQDLKKLEEGFVLIQRI